MRAQLARGEKQERDLETVMLTLQQQYSEAQQLTIEELARVHCVITKSDGIKAAKEVQATADQRNELTQTDPAMLNEAVILREAGRFMQTTVQDLAKLKQKTAGMGIQKLLGRSFSQSLRPQSSLRMSFNEPQDSFAKLSVIPSPRVSNIENQTSVLLEDERPRQSNFSSLRKLKDNNKVTMPVKQAEADEAPKSKEQSDREKLDRIKLQMTMEN